MRLLSVVFALFIVFPQIGRAQTAPAVNDPRIEIRWLRGSAAAAGENINVLVFAEGFLVASKEIFFSAAEKQIVFFLENVPYPNRFNVATVFLPSREDGVDPDYLTNSIDTALDGYLSDGFLSYRLSLEPYIQKALGRAVDFQERKYFFPVIFNTMEGRADSGGGGMIPLGSAQNEPSYVLSHELSHAIVGLADEYWALNGNEFSQNQNIAEAGGVIKGINLTSQLSDIPWYSMLTPGVPLPTTTKEMDSGFGDKVYVCETHCDSVGSFSVANVLYAPTNGWCLMNHSGTLDNPTKFCPVCRHAWEQVILERTGTVNVSAPEEVRSQTNQSSRLVSSIASVESNDGDSFLVSLPDWDFQIFWFVNGSEIVELRGATQVFASEVSDRFNRNRITNTVSIRVVNNDIRNELVYDAFGNRSVQDIATSNFSFSYENETVATATPTPTQTPQPTATFIPSSPTPTATPTPLLPIKPASVLFILAETGSVVINVTPPAGAPVPWLWEIHLYRISDIQGKPAFIGRFDDWKGSNGSLINGDISDFVRGTDHVDFSELTSGQYQVFVAGITKPGGGQDLGPYFTASNPASFGLTPVSDWRSLETNSPRAPGKTSSRRP